MNHHRSASGGTGRSDTSASESHSAASDAQAQSRPEHTQLDLEARTWLQWLWTKTEAALWLMAAAGVLWYGDGYKNLLTVLAQSPHLARSWLYVGFGFLAVNMGIFFYLTVWLGSIRGVKQEWEVAAPWAIPTATATGLLSGIMFTIAFWPVWSFATPIVMLVLFMGLVMSQHFTPRMRPQKATKVD